MFGLKIFVRVQTFQRVPPVLPGNFCHPANHKDYSWGKIFVIEHFCLGVGLGGSLLGLV